MAFTLENIVPWGRSYEEYVSMFSLTPNCLDKKILGCGDGPASFNAHMNRSGRPTISIDPLYRFSAEEIEARIEETCEVVMAQLEQNRNSFKWTTIQSPAALKKIRMASMRSFLADFPRGKTEGRYLDGELPNLPFEDNRFDLAVCSHLLFLYSEHLSREFHLAAIDELCRVAGEVRIFPLLTMSDQYSPYVDVLQEHLPKKGHEVSIERVPYEFQRGGNEMMRIRKSD